jgi:uncharacterized protein YdeI (YjbR/CyaY-like superfamily)
VFYKKASGKQTVSYDHAVEEALCFGWVDGMKKKLDEECYAFRFTPRKAKSAWSKSNLQRVERLIAEGKDDAGRTEGVQFRGSSRSSADAHRTAEGFSKTNSANSARLGRITRSFRRATGAMTAGWVASAKKEETRVKRLEKLMEFSARNERIEFM